MNKNQIETRAPSSLMRGLVATLAGAFVLTLGAAPVSATEVTYVIDGTDGTVADLTLSDYTPATPLSLSDFVLFTLTDPGVFSYTVDPADVTTFSGSIDPSGATPTSVTLDTLEVTDALGLSGHLVGFTEDSTTGDIVITEVRCPPDRICKPVGTGGTVSKKAVGNWTAAPEPGSLGLVLVGIAGGLITLRNRRRTLQA